MAKRLVEVTVNQHGPHAWHAKVTNGTRVAAYHYAWTRSGVIRKAMRTARQIERRNEMIEASSEVVYRGDQ